MLDNICIVLVEPQGSLNIGSVCRSMMNFGISDLRLVNPVANHLNDDARRMAVKATGLLEEAPLFKTLPEALADCHLAIGTTRRFGKYRERFLHPEDASHLLLSLSETGKTALVFGREDHGLSTNELDHCQRLLTIPSHEKFKSLNLAQSVTVCLYELFKLYKSGQQPEKSSKKLASGKEQEAMYHHMQKTLLEIEYLDPQNPDHIMRTFRQIFGRAQLDEREVRILQGLWSRIDWLEEQRQKK